MSLSKTARSRAAFVSHAPFPMLAGAMLAAGVAATLAVAAFFRPEAPLVEYAEFVAACFAACAWALGLTSIGCALACHVWMPTLTADNGALDPGSKTAWALGLLVAGPVLAPIYFWAHLARAPRSPLLDDDTPTLVFGQREQEPKALRWT
jgi:hypothetical protein